MLLRWIVVLILPHLWTVNAAVLPRPNLKHRYRPGRLRLQETPLQVNNIQMPRFHNLPPNYSVRRQGKDKDVVHAVYVSSHCSWFGNCGDQEKKLGEGNNMPNFHSRDSDIGTQNSNPKPLKKRKSKQGRSNAMLRLGKPSYLDQNRFEIYQKVLKNKDRKRNANKWLNQLYQSIERSDELVNNRANDRKLANILDILGNVAAVEEVDNSLQESDDRESKDNGDINIFDNNGMYFVTQPKPRVGNINYVIDKVLRYQSDLAKRSVRAPLSYIFSPDEAQQIKAVARAIDEEDRSYEALDREAGSYYNSREREDAAAQQAFRELSRPKELDYPTVKLQRGGDIAEPDDANEAVVLNFNQLVA